MTVQLQQSINDAVEPTFTQRIAEFVVNIIGNLWFIIAQTIGICLWVCLNYVHIVKFDPYPFILLNLVLSLQAAYMAPMILMAQVRQGESDRRTLNHDHVLDIDTNERMQRIERRLDEVVARLNENLTSRVN
jgi:uncharacterized membrane protein